MHTRVISCNGQCAQTAKKLPWIENGWQLSEQRNKIRKSAAHGDLHGWLKTHEAAGTITRQEAVSMVPPLFLEVESGDRVYDACAAPGSKTTQMVGAMDRERLATASNADATLGSLEADHGQIVLANDERLARAHTLVHQLKRLGSPSWLVTQCDARAFPTIRRPENGKANKLLFNKILCDVPCSSDGTLRKMPTLLAQWGCHKGNALHALQCSIVKRSAQLLAPGGRLVYSTCSMNPVENEAVVAELLRTNRELRVVDTSGCLTALKRRPGLDSWRVFDDADEATGANPVREADDDATHGDKLDTETALKHLQLIKERFEPSDHTTKRKRRPCISIFAPTDAYDQDRCIRDQLLKCMRFVPHDADTGAFFVAVFERRAVKGTDPSNRKDSGPTNKGNTEETSSTFLQGGDEAAVCGDCVQEVGGSGQDNNEVEAPLEELESADANEKGVQISEQPLVKKKTIPEDVEFTELSNVADVQSILDFYGLHDFPIELIVTRTTGDDGDSAKRAVVVSRPVRELVLRAKQNKLRIVHAGTVILQRVSPNAASLAACDYRVVQDGVHLLLPFMRRRVVMCGQADFLVLLQGGVIQLSELTPTVSDLIMQLEVGSFVCVLSIPEVSETSSPPAIVTWRSPGPFVTVYCAKNDLSVLASRLASLFQQHNRTDRPAGDTTDN